MLDGGRAMGATLEATGERQADRLRLGGGKDSAAWRGTQNALSPCSERGGPVVQLSSCKCGGSDGLRLLSSHSTIMALMAIIVYQPRPQPDTGDQLATWHGHPGSAAAARLQSRLRTARVEQQGRDILESM
jgi:hypothetical protein